jgi:DNA repair protein RecO (recombination protein O)
MSTTAIVLSFIRYSDTGSILHLYTADNGRMQYVVYGNKFKALLQPLSVIEITTNRRNNAPNQMPVVSSVEPLSYTITDSGVNFEHAIEHRFSPFTFHPVKQCIAMFIAELLTYTLRHPMADPPLFTWLLQMIYRLEHQDDVRNLHCDFLMDFATFMGFGVDEQEHPEWFVVPATRQQRQQRLRQLLAYFRENVEELPSLKSLDVLIEVFD